VVRVVSSAYILGLENKLHEYKLIDLSIKIDPVENHMLYYRNQIELQQ